MQLSKKNIPGLLCRVIAFFLLFAVYANACAQIQFFDVSQETGTGGLLTSPLSTNCAWGDYDNDGYLDLYVTNWGTSVGSAEDILFRNNTDGTFINVSADAGIVSYDNGIAAIWGDYDSDGYLDLYIVNYFEQDALYRNNGDGTFTDATGEAGVDANPLGNSTHAVWGDYDLDGDIDLYLSKAFAANELYANNGDGTFTERGAAAGVNDIRDSQKASWIDYDGDGDLDLYVVNREQDSALYRNNGNGTFTNASGIAALNDTEIGKGLAWGDYNNNGFIDLYLANIGANKLYRNNGNGTFSETGATAGVRSNGTGWEYVDAAWGDYDADGDLDLFVVGGSDSDSESNGFFLNIGGQFINVIGNSGDLSAGPLRATSCAFADYDNDGDLDIYMTSYRDAQLIPRNALYQNQLNGNRYLRLKIRGKGPGFSNTFGIGAKVKIFDSPSGTFRAMREIVSGSGPLEAHFGLSAGTYRIEVTFPGVQQTVLSQNVTVPAVLTVQEP